MRTERLGLSCLNTEKVRTILIETNERLAAVSGNSNLIFKCRYHFQLATGYCRLLAKITLGERISNPHTAKLICILTRETPWLSLDKIQRAIATLEGLTDGEEKPDTTEIQWTIDLFANLGKAYFAHSWKPRPAKRRRQLHKNPA